MNMVNGLFKAVANLSIALMAFFGWQTPEYKNALPKEVNQYIPETTATTTAPVLNPFDEKIKELEEPVPTKVQSTPKALPPQKKVPTPQIIPVPKTTQPQKSTPSVTLPKTPAPVVKVTPPVETPKVEVPSIPVTTLSPEEKIAKATVNIYCSRIIDRSIEKITGSGVVINPQGIILTNAHVAEYVLLSEYQGANTTCAIRGNSPAQSYYRAKVVFIPSEWITANKNNLSSTNLQGTGEYDYAVLGITELLSRNAPNVPLPYFELSDSTPAKNQNILLGGYPANFGSVAVLDNSLYFLHDNSQITSALGFNGSGVDVITTGATSLAEHGSSGGPITSDGKLIGLIDSTVLDSGNKKAIQGITTNYIEKSIQKASGKSLQNLIDNSQNEIADFEKNHVSYLGSLLLGK